MKIYKKIVLGISATSIALLGFRSREIEEYTLPHTVTQTNELTNEHPGKVLLETKCYACHHPSSAENTRIAPPMIAIKKHYIDEKTTYADFKEALWTFVEKPTSEKAKLKGAVRKFGVMPYQAFNKEDIEKIADYLYHQDIASPDWFEEHYKKGHTSKNSQ